MRRTNRPKRGIRDGTVGSGSLPRAHRAYKPPFCHHWLKDWRVLEAYRLVVPAENDYRSEKGLRKARPVVAAKGTAELSLRRSQPAAPAEKKLVEVETSVIGAEDEKVVAGVSR